MIRVRHLLTLVALVCCELFCASCFAQSVRWRRGRDLERQTQFGVSGSWADAPLQPLLRQLSQGLGVPLFIDRRVDPGLAVSLVVRDLTWDQFLFELGDPHGYGFCRLEGIYYFGPREAAYSLPQHFEKLTNWVAKHRETAAVNWRRHVPGSWSHLSQPRELLQGLAGKYQLETYQLDKIPFDLWGEYDSPAIPLVLHTSLLAVGFDQWIAISKSGKKLKFIPYPEQESNRYKVSKVEDPSETARKLEAEFPSLKIRTDKRSVELEGPKPEIEQAIAAAIRAQRPIKSPESSATFSGDLKGMRRNILKAIADQLGAELILPTETVESLDKFIEMSVKDLSGEEIIRETLDSTGLDFQLNGKNLRIFRSQ